jgi:hypothetical protein
MFGPFGTKPEINLIYNNGARGAKNFENINGAALAPEG